VGCRLVTTAQLVPGHVYLLAVHVLQIVVEPAACDHIQFKRMYQIRDHIILYTVHSHRALHVTISVVELPGGGTTCLHSAEETTESLDEQLCALLDRWSLQFGDCKSDICQHRSERPSHTADLPQGRVVPMGGWVRLEGMVGQGGRARIHTQQAVALGYRLRRSASQVQPCNNARCGWLGIAKHAYDRSRYRDRCVRLSG